MASGSPARVAAAAATVTVITTGRQELLNNIDALLPPTVRTGQDLILLRDAEQASLAVDKAYAAWIAAVQSNDQPGAANAMFTIQAAEPAATSAKSAFIAGFDQLLRQSGDRTLPASYPF